MILKPTWELLTAPSIMETTSIVYLVEEYRKAMDIYDELMKRNDYDKNIHAFKACC